MSNGEWEGIFILDSSVIAKIFVNEELSKEAAELLINGREAGFKFKISHLIFFEVGNVIWKFHRKDKKKYGGEMFFQLFMLDIETVHFDPESAQEVLKLAHRMDISFYDAVHASLAESAGGLLVTEDAKLRNTFPSAVGIIDALNKITLPHPSPVPSA